MSNHTVIKVKQDPDTKECYLDIADFNVLGYDTTKIAYYALEEIDDDNTKALLLKFFDDEGNLLKPKKDDDE